MARYKNMFKVMRYQQQGIILGNQFSPFLFHTKYTHPSSSVYRGLCYGEYGKLCRGDEKD